MSLHDTALNAQTALEKLATELAHEGVDRGTVAAVTKMAELTRKLVTQIADQDREAPPPESPEQSHPETMDSAIDSLTPSGRAGGGQ